MKLDGWRSLLEPGARGMDNQGNSVGLEGQSGDGISVDKVEPVRLTKMADVDGCSNPVGRIGGCRDSQLF